MSVGDWRWLENDIMAWSYECVCGEAIYVWSSDGCLYDHWRHGEGEALLVLAAANESYRIPEWLARVHAYERATLDTLVAGRWR